MAGAAPTTTARQLPWGAARAHPRARRVVPTTATSPCRNREAVRRRSYPQPREPTSPAYLRSPEFVQTPKQPQAISLELP